jgi:hypothetical protein
MKSLVKFGCYILPIVGVAIGIASCNSNNGSSTSTPAAQPGTSLYNKYGGAATIQKVVTDIGTALIADCTQNPFFTTTINFDNVQVDGDGHGSNGFDTIDRLNSCLVAQFTAAFGGPSSYTGTATVSGVPSLTIPGQTYNCQDMVTAHNAIGVNPAVFDQFIADAGMVLLQDGVSQADVNTIASALMGFQTQIVAPVNDQRFYNYQPGEPVIQASPSLSCQTIPSPAPSPSPSASPSPSPAPSSSPSASAASTRHR